ncbi:MAG: CHAD domain-containing protein [Alphaproteobacteria bacterium]
MAPGRPGAGARLGCVDRRDRATGKESLPNEPGLAALLDVARSFRDKAYASAHEAIQSPRYTALILQLQLWLETDAWIADGARIAGNGGAGNGVDAGQEAGQKADGTSAAMPFAIAILDSRRKKLVKLARRRKKLSDAELHDVRIAAKKLRYAGDLFADLFGRGRARTYLGRLAAMQDALGSLNDGVTAGLLLASVTGGRKNTAALDRAVGIALGWGAARIRADTARFADLWQSFARTKPFWT